MRAFTLATLKIYEDECDSTRKEIHSRHHTAVLRRWIEVRDREAAITRTRGACAPQNRRTTRARRQGRRGAAGRRRERRPAWAVFRALVFYWVIHQSREAD